MEGNDETALMAHTMLTLIVLRKKDLDERKRQISRQTHDFGSICIVTVMLNLSPYSVATHMIFLLQNVSYVILQHMVVKHYPLRLTKLTRQIKLPAHPSHSAYQLD